MLDQLLNFINEQKLFHPDDKVILAVSGGVDSMVMAHLFQQTGFRFAFAHCNFQLRGDESDSDQLLVEQTAISFKVPIYIKSFPTTEYAKKHGISIQMAARELRQSWFEELLENEGYDLIATAHHLNDSIETALFNLAKGTGISGLKGIPPKNNQYIRPLMFASRAMILDYARVHHIEWNEDRSNRAVKYHRNLIRHHIVPELKKINPNLEQTFSASIEKIEAAEKIYQNYIRDAKDELIERIGNGIRLDKRKINSIPEGRMVLYETLNEYGFNYQQAKNIFKKMDGQTGKTFSSKRYQLVVDRQYLFVSTIAEIEDLEVVVDVNTAELKIGNLHLYFEKINAKDAVIKGDENTAFLDLDKLKFPLVIRLWRKGDHFQPLGMKHKKKLSDFMIDEKIPLNLKQQLRVLTSGEEVVWIIGHRIDDRYKITSQTRQVYKVYNRNFDDKSL